MPAVMHGTCWLKAGEGAPIALVAGDCFVLPSGCSALLGSTLSLEPTLASAALSPDRDGETVVYNGGGDVLLVGSRFEVSGRHSQVALRTLPPVIHLHEADDQAMLRWSIAQMTQELRDPRPGSTLIAQHLAHLMLAQTLRLHLERQSATDAGWFAALADAQLGAAISAMHADPSHAWTLDTLAERASMSRTVFARRFRQVLNETPIAYLTRWRMLLAAERLIAGRETLARIAHAVGYDSENAFNTAFARVMGISPRRYARTAEDVV